MGWPELRVTEEELGIRKTAHIDRPGHAVHEAMTRHSGNSGVFSAEKWNKSPVPTSTATSTQEGGSARIRRSGSNLMMLSNDR